MALNSLKKISPVRASQPMLGMSEGERPNIPPRGMGGPDGNGSSHGHGNSSHESRGSERNGNFPVNGNPREERNLQGGG